MYPYIIIWNIRIYLFWVFLVIAWLIFFYCLHIFSAKKWIIKPIFSDILSFTFSIFLFGRLFYIIWEWRESKFLFQSLFTGDIGFLDFLYKFLISHDYKLSLVGWIIGFLIVFFIKTKKTKNYREYLDIIMPSFVIAGIIGYIWAIFGGQLYGIPYNWPLSLDYATKYSEVPLRTNLFPLPIFYIIWLLWILFFYLKKSEKNLPEWYIWYMMLGMFGFLLFFGEFFNWSEDIFSIFIKLNHLTGVLFIFISILWNIKILKS